MNAALNTSSIVYEGDLDKTGNPKPFTVVAPDGLHPTAKEQLKDANGIELLECRSNPATKMPDNLDADGYIIRSKSKPETPEKITRLTRASIITRIGVGTNNIHKKTAAQRGMLVLNTPGASTGPVARLATMFIEMWARRYKENMEALRGGRWVKDKLELRDLSKMTLGVVGWGRIGSDLARRMEEDDIFRNTLFNDTDPEQPGVTPLLELIAKSNVISLHADTEKKFIGAEELADIQEGSLIVNTARDVIEPNALLAVMNEKDVSYATDVYDDETEEGMNDPLTQAIINHPNFAGTQHIGASDPGTKEKLGREGARCITEFAQLGKVREGNLTLPIFPAIDPGSRKTPGARMVLTHESKPGPLHKITGTIAGAEISIEDLTNREGEPDNGNRLAMTVLDLPHDVDPKKALKIMQTIQARLDAMRTRILWYTDNHVEHIPAEAEEKVGKLETAIV